LRLYRQLSAIDQEASPNVLLAPDSSSTTPARITFVFKIDQVVITQNRECTTHAYQLCYPQRRARKADYP
jgi:hypothetical protein